MVWAHPTRDGIVNARSKFLIGGALVLSSAGYLMASSIKSTGTYYLTPTELAARVRTDASFHDVGLKMGAKVVKGTIARSPGGREVRFRITDGQQEYPVVYKGIIPDTFTDGVDVVVDGRLQANGTFEATVLLAKCASRYENAPTQPGAGGHPDGVPRGDGYPAPAAPATTPAPSSPASAAGA